MEEDIDPAYLRQLETAFRSIKPKHQRLIQMSRVDGLSYAEIAERLGTSVKQVERRMAQAILALDRAMDEFRRPWWRFW
ncbi:MAG: sigma-70 region 4 domain-containing protein [Pseudomonadota bacterium]|nr:sigma-70 region 4 domain-containing protein [Pseudomonadota bacterium]